MTPQRVAIYSALVATISHPSADELLMVVRKHAPRISANTVYYTLGALQKAGLVHEVNFGHDRARFDGNVAPHHHALCQGCRRIIDIVDAGLDRTVVWRAAPRDFEVTGHRVEVYGYCAGCHSQRSQ